MKPYNVRMTAWAKVFNWETGSEVKLSGAPRRVPIFRDKPSDSDRYNAYLSDRSAALS